MSPCTPDELAASILRRYDDAHALVAQHRAHCITCITEARNPFTECSRAAELLDQAQDWLERLDQLNTSGIITR